MWWQRIALTFSILAAALLVFSGLGVRAGLWPFRVGFGMFAGAMLTGLAAIGAATIVLAVPRLREAARPIFVVTALLLGVTSRSPNTARVRASRSGRERHPSRTNIRRSMSLFSNVMCVGSTSNCVVKSSRFDGFG